MNSKLLVTVLSALVFAGSRLQAAGDDSALLSTLGYTTGQSVMLTHMAVGTLADAYVAKTYKPDQASTFINTYINVTKGMKEQLTKLLDANTLDKSDTQFVKNTIDVLDLVVKESEELKAYIITGDSKEAQAYDKARQKALKAIQTLLGIKD